MNGMTARIGVGLYVDDIDKMVSFYRDTLEFETEHGGLFAQCKTKSGPVSLFMYDKKEFVKSIGEPYHPSSGINTTMEIAVWLPSFSDVDDEYKRLMELGIKSLTGEPITYAWGIRCFYIADPEGNLLEIGSTGKDDTR